MSSSSIFNGHYHTPFGPAEALHLSPMRCSITHARPPGKRSVTSQFELQPKSHWSKNPKAPLYTRSVSATSSLPIKKARPTPTPVEHSRATSGQHAMFAGLNIHEVSEAYLHGQQYTPKQVACHDIYKHRARLSWSQEYGRPIPIENCTPTSPISPQSRPISPPPRIVELEGSPTVPAARFQRAAIALAGHIRRSDEALRSPEISPTRNTVMVIKRKPVGSGISPRTSPTRQAAVLDLCPPPKTYASPADIDESPSPSRNQAWRLSADAFDPEELLSLPTESRLRTPSNSNSSPDRNKNITLRKQKQRSKPPQAVRFRSDADSIISDSSTTSDPHLDLASLTQTSSDFIAGTWTLIDTHVFSRSHYAKDNMIYAFKLGVILYLAACAWSILSAVRDGILRSVQPLVMLWEFVRWLVSSGW